MVEAAEDTQVRAAVIEGVAPLSGELHVVTWQTFEVRVARPEAKPVKVILHDVVNDTGNRVGTVNGRCTITQHFDALEAEYR